MKAAARLGRLEAAKEKRERAAWDAMSLEERWAYMQRWRATSPAFAAIWDEAEKQVSAMSQAELLALVDDSQT